MGENKERNIGKIEVYFKIEGKFSHVVFSLPVVVGFLAVVKRDAAAKNRLYGEKTSATIHLSHFQAAGRSKFKQRKTKHLY